MKKKRKSIKYIKFYRLDFMAIIRIKSIGTIERSLHI